MMMMMMMTTTTMTIMMFVTRKHKSLSSSVLKIFEKAVLIQTLWKFVFCLLKVPSETKKVEGLILHFTYFVSERDKKQNLFFKKK